MQDYLDNSYDMNVTDLDIAIERFNIDIVGWHGFGDYAL